MPNVPLNRLYKVRSTARTPVPVSTHIPDAAGAYLRGVLPGQRAAIQIAGENARIENGRLARRGQRFSDGIQAIASGIGIWQRAMERQSADAIRKAQNAARKLYLEGENAAMATPYNVTGDDGKREIDGPLPAMRRLGDGVSGLMEVQALGKRDRDAFEEWFGTFRAEKEQRADLRQRALQQEDRQRTILDSASLLDGEIAKLQDLGEYADWGQKVKERIDLAIHVWKLGHGIEEVDGEGGYRTLKSMTDGQQAAFAGFEREQYDKYNLQRLRYLAGVLGAIDDPNDPQVAEISAHLNAWGMTPEEYAAQNKVETDFHPDNETRFLDDRARQEARALLADATAKHKAAIRTHDAVLTSDLSESLAGAFSEADPAARAAALQDIDARESEFRSGQAREVFEAVWDKRLAESQSVALRKLETASETDQGVLLAQLRGSMDLFKDDENRMVFQNRMDKALTVCAENVENGIILEETKETRDSYVARLEGMAGEFDGAAFKVAHRERVEHAKALADTEDFREAMDDYEAAVEGLEGDGAQNVKAALAARTALEAKAKGLRTGAGRAAALKHVQGLHDGQAEEVLGVVTDALEFGWYFDERKKQLVGMSREDAMGLYETYLPFMSKAQRAKAHKAFDNNRPRLNQGDLDALSNWLGFDAASKLFDWGKIEASEDGQMSFAPNRSERGEGWDADGTIELRGRVNGKKQKADFDRAMARRIWEVADRFVAMRDAGMLDADPSKSRAMTLPEFLDEKCGKTMEGWRSFELAAKIDETAKQLEWYEAQAIFGNEPEADGTGDRE